MSFRRILAAVDASDNARLAAERAAALARRSDAGLLLLHVYDTVPDEAASMLTATSLNEDSRRQAELLLRELKTSFADLEPRSLVVPSRDIAGTICEVAASEASDLITVGTLGRTGVARFFLGSVAERVVRQADCPVWVVRAPGAELSPLERVVICTDLSPSAEPAVALGSEVAAAYGLSAELVVAVEPAYRQLELNRRRQVVAEMKDGLAELAKRHFGEVTPRLSVLEGDNVVDAITSHAIRTSAHLLVVATHGRTGLERIVLGSVAEKVTRFAPCSVLVARSQPTTTS